MTTTPAAHEIAELAQYLREGYELSWNRTPSSRSSHRWDLYTADGKWVCAVGDAWAEQALAPSVTGSFASRLDSPTTKEPGPTP